LPPEVAAKDAPARNLFARQVFEQHSQSVRAGAPYADAPHLPSLLRVCSTQSAFGAPERICAGCGKSWEVHTPRTRLHLLRLDRAGASASQQQRARRLGIMHGALVLHEGS
jgi:hypothetical protein